MAGRKPKDYTPEGVDIKHVLNRFLTSKKLLLDAGELSALTFREYHTVCEQIKEEFGLERVVEDLDSEDFDSFRASLAKTLGPVALGNRIQRVRTVFNFAFEAGLIEKPVRFGPTFKKPSRNVMRKAKAEKGPRMWEAHEIRRMLEKATPQMKAMILLGINCGFGNHDCGTLPRKALDLEGGWIDYARPKTGVQRRCPLWAETVEAIVEAMKSRSKPKFPEDDQFVFLTKYGQPWAKVGYTKKALQEDENSSDEGNSKKPLEANARIDNPVSKEFAKLVKALKIQKKGVGFYGLRHGFETIAGESRDQPAVDHVMGHATEDMASTYRERISDDRLRDVVDVVRKWLFTTEDEGG